METKVIHIGQLNKYKAMKAIIFAIVQKRNHLSRLTIKPINPLG
jgi:hypothetical protein